MEGQPAPRDAVEYCSVVAFVSTGDPRFTLGDSRPIYEQLVAPHKRMIDDVLLRRGLCCLLTSETFGGHDF